MSESIESLTYWHERRRRLPWYRRRARQEAERMATRLEQRIAEAVRPPSNLPLDAWLAASLSLGWTRFERWARRARVVLLAAVTAVVALSAISVFAAVAVLSRLL